MKEKRNGTWGDQPHRLRTHCPEERELETVMQTLRDLAAEPDSPAVIPLAAWVARLRRKGLQDGGRLVTCFRQLEAQRRVTIHEGCARVGR